MRKCKLPSCGLPLVRKVYQGKRVQMEPLCKFLDRDFCDKKCYSEFRKIIGGNMAKLSEYCSNPSCGDKKTPRVFRNGTTESYKNLLRRRSCGKSACEDWVLMNKNRKNNGHPPWEHTPESIWQDIFNQCYRPDMYDYRV